MTQTLTSQQALLIARTLDRLDTMTSEADQMFLKIELRDPQFNQDSPDAVIGTFSEEDGTWLFSFRTLEPKRLTLTDVARVTYKQNPSFYDDRKIKFIKDTREEWGKVTGAASSLVDTKNACEEIFRERDIKALREKMLRGDDYQYDLGENEDRAYAEHRERMAEQGTWFGAPGPMDEEPF